MTQVTLAGNSIKLNGTFPKVGDKAKEFTLTKTDLSDCTLADFAGKIKVLNIVPSLDTPVCQLSSKKFNEQLAQMANVACIVVAVDTPFAMKRVADQECLNNTVTLSTLHDQSFATNYGVQIVDGVLKGCLARAVVVIGDNNVVIHAELVSEIKNEPNYEEAMKIIKAMHDEMCD